MQTEIKNTKKIFSYLEIAQKASKKAGNILFASYHRDTDILSSIKKDIKTQADLDAENAVLEILAQTGFPILSEEKGVVKDVEFDSPRELLFLDEPIWIVDPLDGTYNFTREFPFCCVSIALWANGGPMLGVIFDFLKKELYSGSITSDATCNGRKILVSSTADISQSCLASGFPTGRDFDSESMLLSVSRFQSYKKIRMIGSAAMSLVNVAKGSFDAYCEECIKIWDVAAGLAIVEAAGGKTTISDIDESWQVDVLATNKLLFDQSLFKH